jgi:hypothetical protein
LKTSAPEQPPPPIHHKESKKQGGYVYLKASKKDKPEAHERISETLHEVHHSLHFTLQSERNTATLYVRNLEYNTSEQDVRDALNSIFQSIRVERITSPKVQGQSLYCFIKITWA